MDHDWFAAGEGGMYFAVHTAQAPGCSVRALSQVDLVFCTRPRSEPLRFSVLCKGTDAVGLYILCPFQVQAAQVTGCLVSALSQVGHVSLFTSPVLATQFPGCATKKQSQECCVSPLGS